MRRSRSSAPRGEPTDLDTLLGPPVPVDEDGGPLLRRAWAWLADHPDPIAEWPDGATGMQSEFDSLPDDERAAVRAYVRTLEPFIGDVRRGTAMRRWRQLATESLDPSAELPHVPHIQRSLRALDAALNAVPEGADPALGSQVRLGLLRARGLLGVRWDRPLSLIESLVAFVVVRSTLERTRELLESRLIEPAETAEILRPIFDWDAHQMLLHGLRSERVFTISIARRVLGDDSRPLLDEDGKPLVPGKFPRWMTTLSRGDVIDYMRTMESIVDSRDQRWSALSEATLGIDLPGAASKWKGPAPSITGASSVVLPRFVESGARVAALQRLARLATAADVHRNERGVWPATIDAIDVSVEVRVDPYTDEPFDYELLPDGRLRISSPGPTHPNVWVQDRVDKNDPKADGLVWTLSPR